MKKTFSSAIGLLLFSITVFCAIRVSTEPEPAAVITVIEGEGVSMKKAGESDWIAAVEETELPAGSSIKTDANSRAELQFADNSMLRVDSISTITINKPKPESTLIETIGGKMWLHLKKLEKEGAFEIKTPQASAGVRGTTFWVESTPGGEDVIGVEDGEVEVTRGQRRIRLQKLMKVSARRGTLDDAEKFDPEKRKKWEHFTHNIVKQKFENVRDAISKYRDEAKGTLTSGKEMLAEFRQLDADSRSAVKQVEALVKRSARLTEQVNELEGKVKSEAKLGPVQRRIRLRQSKKQADALLEQAEKLGEEFKSTKEKLDNFFESSRRQVQSSTQLSERIRKLQAAHEQMAARTDLEKRRREFDPQWPALEKIHQAARERIGEFHEQLGLIDNMLSGLEDRTTDKTKKLIDRVTELRDYIENNKSQIADAVKDLAKSTAKLKKISEALEKSQDGK